MYTHVPLYTYILCAFLRNDQFAKALRFAPLQKLGDTRGIQPFSPPPPLPSDPVTSYLNASYQDEEETRTTETDRRSEIQIRVHRAIWRISLIIPVSHWPGSTTDLSIAILIGRQITFGSDRDHYSWHSLSSFFESPDQLAPRDLFRVYYERALDIGIRRIK